ncbi:MAG: 50S ribosome-binding GTPase [Gemmataceae bacterium]|nr:50S ribosome-binding GTPase [Gemmataceae bacterium]
MPDNLRIILFGAPGAGKSSLIGALAQAGQSQTAQLGGQLVDVSGGMAELKKQAYHKGLAPTQDELREYPLAVEPLAPGQGAAQTATLIDCSGQAAQAIMASHAGLPPGSPLAQALLNADSLILLVDAGAPERGVAAIGDFVKLFQHARGQRADIAGLPVYLVLSKVDTIAEPNDTYNQWVQRIEESKRRLDQRFRTLLQDQAGLPFGRVQVHLSATAVQRPALADRAAKAEPFGVAELFRESLASARSHWKHREHAAGRLSLAVAGMLALVALLGVLAATLYYLRPSPELTALENQVRRVLPASADNRMREPIEERLKELAQIQADPHFGELAPKLRDEVEQAAAEMERYQKLYKEFQAQVIDPRFVTRDEELDKIEKSLDAFALPDEYLSAWSDTRLVQRMQKWKQDVAKLRAAAKDEEAWIGQQLDEAQRLRKQGGLVVAKSLPADQSAAWFKQVQEYLDRTPRHKRTDRLPGSTSLTYDHVYRLQRVERAFKEWEAAKRGLEDLRKLAQ